MKSRIMRVLIMLLICGGIALFPITAYAQDEKVVVTKLETLLTATENTDALEKPVVGATVIFSYEKDQSVLVTGETQDGWYQVAYQGNTGYIQKDKLGDSVIDEEALQQEMENAEMADKLFVEEVERLRAEKSRSKIWGIVIILLVATIFALGIISSIKSMNNDNNNKDNQNADEEKPAKNQEKEVNVAANEVPELDIIDIDDED